MIQTHVGAVRRSATVALVSSAMLLVGLGQGSAHAEVTAFTGSAYGYYCAVTAFNIPCSPANPTPKVMVAPGGSNARQTATAPSGNAFTGPATLFSSGRIDVSTDPPGPSAPLVASSTNIAKVNASGNEPFTAANLASSCSASEIGGATGSTTINGGTLQTDNGDSDPTNTVPDHAPVDVPLPTNPAPNTSYDGHVHIGNTTDTFTYVFNEQVMNAARSITVNAAHQYLRGPVALGDVIIGQSVCGVTTAAPAQPPAKPPANFPATAGNDTFRAGAGNDNLQGLAGKDLLCGGAGNDTIDGGDGNDRLFGDRCSGVTKTTDGNDRVKGGKGNDTLTGGGGNDRLSGGEGNDRLSGGADNDRVDGGEGNDKLTGDSGNDKLTGGAGNDSLTDRSGVNAFSAGAGNDTINAVNGKKEKIDCGTGKDTAQIDTADTVSRCETIKRAQK